MTRRFTGRHMFLTMAGFFGTVIAVNVTMAVFAATTFGGTVVDNSYVASQRFNGWLEAARAQEALGWQPTLSLGADRRVVLALADAGGPLNGAAVSAIATHPVGRVDDVALAFVPAGAGRYRSTDPLPAGRWNLALQVEQGGRSLRRIESLR